MVGNDTINLMKDNWEKYLPAIKSFSNKKKSTESTFSSLTALPLLDKQFRSGTTANHSGAYQIYEVNITIVYVIVIIVV